MADDHVGFSITPKVDLSGFDKAVQLSNKFEDKLNKIDQGLSRLHAPSALPREINHIDTVTASYVQRLESEGKHYQANQERVKAYQNAIRELSEKQKGLEHLLETSSQGINKNSDSYRRLQIRANQNTVELNKFKQAVAQTNSEMRHSNPTFLDRIKSKLSGVAEKADQTHRSIKDIFMGSALGNMASNALGNLSGQFSGAIKRGMELNGAVGKINARFKGMGASDKQIGALDKQISNLKFNTNMTGDNVANLQARMQNWSKIGKQGAMQMTTAIAGIGDSSKMTGDDIERMSTGLMRVGASGKVTLSSLNRITKTAPTFYAQLAKGAGMSQSRLKALLATGDVTQKRFQTWLANSSKYSNSAFKAFGQTQGGAIHQIQVRWDAVKAQLTKPLFDAKSSGLQSLKSILTSKEVTSGANAIGHAISNAVGYLDKHKQDISGITRDVVKIGVEIGKSVWKDFSDIVVDIGHALGIVHGHGNALHQFKETLDGIAKNKGAIQLTAKAIIAIATVKGLTHVGSGLFGVGVSAYKSYRKLKALHDGLKGVQTVGKFTKAEGAFNSLGGSIRGVITKLGEMKRAGSTLGGVGGKVFGAAGTGLIAGQQGIQAIKDRHDASARSQDIGGGIGAVAGGALTSMIPVVGPMLAPIGALVGKYAGRWGGQAVDKFTKGWQSHKPPKQFWSFENLGWSTRDTFSKIGKWGGQVGHSMGTAIGKAGGFVKKNGKELALTAVSPMLGIPTLLYKNNPKFKRWANNAGNTIKGGFKSAGDWIKNIPSNLGKTGKSIGNWANKTGKDIHKGWNEGIKASHNFFKNLPKNTHNFVRSTQRNFSSFVKSSKSSMSRFGKNVKNGFSSGYKKARSEVHGFGKWYGKTWDSIWRSVNNNRYVKAFKKGQFFQTAFKDMRSRWNGFSKWFGRGWNSFWSKTSKTASRDWNGTKRNWNNFWGAMPKRWNSFKSSFGKAWGSFWSGIGKGFSNVVKGIRSAWDNTIGGIVKAWDGMKKNLGAFGKWISNSWTGTKNNVKGFANDISYATGGSKHAFKYDKFKSHASGGQIASSHTALVGEAGPELAYKNGRDARLLGANGPQITKVNSGEHILNARDTAKVMSGGLGQGYKLKGYASGTDKLSKTTKTVSSDYKKIASDATKSLNKLKKNNDSSWSKVHKTSTKSVNAIQSHNSSVWRKITSQTGKYNSKTRAKATREYTGMRKGVDKQMDNLHDGVISTANSTSRGFGKAMERMRSYAKKAMSDTIGQINHGISGIDKVLQQFGGNGSVIKPVHFAKGTGALDHNTLAVVNDAKSGPRQEAIVKKSGDILIPHGNDRMLPLAKGDAVLNGTQTQELAHSMGVEHFAKGTGVSHSRLQKIAKDASKNPSKSFAQMYTSNVKPVGHDVGKDFIGLSRRASTHYGDPWSDAMWSVIMNAIDDGDGGPASGLLKAVEDYGEGHKYVWGATGPSTFDCSGLVMYALNKKYGIKYPHFSGAQYAETQHISKSEAHMGDLVFWGPGHHVGVYAGGDKYFSAQSPSQGIHMNTLESVVGEGRPMFGRVRGLKQDDSSKKKNTANKGLMALAKRELGASALKWIKDNLGEGGSYGNPAGDGVARWRKYITKAANQMHTSVNGTEISKILSMISAESSGNPTITQKIQDVNSANGDPAQGLLQFIPPTFSAYAVKGHHNIKNGYDQLLALFNDSNWKRDIHFGGGWGPSGGRRFAKGGNPRVGDTVMVGENGPELAKFTSPVHVYSNEQSKKLNFTDLLNKKPARQASNSKPVINININGNISSVAEANRVSDIVARKIGQLLDGIADNWGTEPDAY